MANENLGSTVLHEHRKIVTLRHLLALVNFIAILASTVITRHFVLIRGTSDGVLMIINALCIINALQILLCIIDYITKVMMGKYSKGLTRLSYAVGVIWFIAVVLEFVSGTLVLGSIRVDLGVIALLQLLTAIIAYVAWPHIDYATVRKMTHKNVRDDLDKRAKKARGGAAKYVLVCMFMVVLQIGMLFAYKLPPKVYDLFSESRQLQYQLAEDGQSYEVIGIYRGTSSFVNVPAVYNNKPVSKINEGALSNADFLENNKVDRIEIGTPTTNEDGVTTLVSNVVAIENGAIVNDKITTLTLPASILKIEDGAIQSSSLKTIVYEARADFAYSYLSCSSLTTVTFSGLEAGKIVSLDGMSNSVTLEVDKDTYNNYREKNKEYMSSIRPILPDTEFVIDFYTNSDYYIESIFGTRGETVTLNVTDFKNDKLYDMVPVSVDMRAYFSDRHEVGTAGAKADSAFRGWYTDQVFTDECEFTNDTISFTGDTAIYAKWIDEYTGTLDWGTYYYPGELTTLYWTDEDPVTFPVIEDRPGFKYGIEWTVNGKPVTTSHSISESVTVNGRWLFDTPVIDINPYAQNTSDNNYQVSPDKNTVNFVYDEYQMVHLEAIMSHEFETDEGFFYSTQWTKVDDSAFSSASKTIDVQNVLESGEYKLRVTATSRYGDESYSETTVSVEIQKKDLDIGTAKLLNTVKEYNAQEQRLLYEGAFVHDKIVTSYTYYDADGNVIEGADSVKDVGRYKVVAHFEKNNAAEAANYNTKELHAEFEITPYELEFVGWSTDELVYNTSEQTVRLLVNGIRANDAVEILYEGNKATNAGDYVAKAVGVSNPNYSIKSMDAANNCTHTWKILPKEISVKEWKLDGSVTSSFSITYNGEAHVLEAVPEGVYSSDLENVKFIYDQTANTVTATNANVYTAKIIGVDNNNYTLAAESTQAWEITKRNVTVFFDTAAEFVYNGKAQSVTATLSGIAEKDLDLFTREKLLYEGKSEGLTVSELTKDDANLTVSFSAKNAAAYTAYVSGIDSASDISLNYTLTSTSHDFAISPKTINVIDDYAYTYTGKTQNLGVKIQGIESSDIDGVSYDQFTTTTLQNGEKIGEYYVLTLIGKDAGSYAYDVTAFSNSNYNLVAKSGEVKIAKKALSVEWQISDLAKDTDNTLTLTDGLEVMYNFKGYSINAKISGLVNDETVALDYVSSQLETNAGSYTTTVSLPETYVNYAFPTESINWSIKPYVVDFSWTFNGKTQSVEEGTVPTFTYTAKPVEILPVYKLLGTDTIDITYVSGKGDLNKTDAYSQNYAVAIESIGNDNYVIGANSAFEWKIDPKTVTVSWVNNPTTVVYDGKYHGPQFTMNGVLEDGLAVRVSVVNGDNISALTNLEITSLDEAAKYDFTATDFLINANNYTCEVISIYKPGEESTYVKDTNYVVSCKSLGYVIDKAELTLGGWSYEDQKTGLTAPYTATTVLTYNQSGYVLTNSIKEELFKRGEIIDDVYLDYSQNSKVNYSEDGYVATVVLAGAHADNYVLNDVATLSWRIEQKPIAAIWTENTFVYNGSYRYQEATYETGATAANDNKVYTGDYISFSYSGYNYRNAGEYTATITNIYNNNYKLTEGNTYEWSIAPISVDYGSLAWSATEFTYNGYEQYPTAYYYSSSTYEYVYVGKYDIPEDSTSANNTNGYTVYALTLDNSNFVLTGVNSGKNYKINPRVVNFTWGYEGNFSSGNYTYDGSERTVVARPDACNGDVIEVTYNQNNLKVHDAKTYEFSVKSIDNPNYILNDSSSGRSYSVTVSQRSVNLTWGFGDNTSNASNYTYDGEEREITAHITNLCDGDKVTLVYGPESHTLHDAATYSFTVTAIDGLDSHNYVLSNTVTKTITVYQKELRFDWYFGNNEYDVAQNFTYNGTTYVLNAVPTDSTLVDGDKVTVKFDKSDRSMLNAGTYTFKVTGLEGEHAKNYSIPTSSSYNSKTITVSKQTVTVTWSGNSTVEYDGNLHSLTATVTGVTGTGINKKTVYLTPTYKNSTSGYINAGSYTITVNGLSDSNYQLPTDGSQNHSLVINKQAVIISWTPSAGVSLNSDGYYVVYDGNAHSLTATVKGAKDNKTITAFSYTNSYTSAGTYTINVSINDSNYTRDGSDYSKKLTINKQTLVIKWYDKNGVELDDTYEAMYDGTYHDLTCKAFNAAGNQISLSMNSVSSPINVGETTYTIYRIYNSTDRSNYQLPTDGSEKHTVKIYPQPVKITWSGEGEITYDGSSHYLTATVVGYNNNTDVSFSYDYYSSNSIWEVGELTRTITLNSSNYTLENSEGSATATLKIVPASVIITWEGMGTHEFKGDYYYLTPTVTDMNGNTVYSELELRGDTSFYGLGEYSCTIVAINDRNYTLDNCVGFLTATAEVVPCNATIEWEGQETVEYDYYTHYVYVYVKDSEGNVIYSETYSAYSVGTHEFTLNLPYPASYYNIVDGDTTFTMEITY